MRKTLRQFLLLTFIFMFAPEGQAQENGLMASFGGATFQMDDMKYLQEYLLSTYPVDGEIISSFPLYTAASINAFKQLRPAIRIGLGYYYTVTGAKSDYSDYSGSLHTLFNAASHRLGAFVYYTFLGKEKLDLSLFGRLDANISRMDIGTTVNASGLYSTYRTKYKSLSPNASAGLELMYNFKDYAIGIEGGYLIDLPGELKDTESDGKLLDPDNRSRILTTDWSGWRVGIKAIMWLRAIDGV